MLVLLLLSSLLLLAALGGALSLLAGLGSLLFRLIFQKKKVSLKRPLVLILAGIVLLAANPFAWRAAHSAVQYIQYGVSGKGGAHLLVHNAPGSGFVWQEMQFLPIEPVEYGYSIVQQIDDSDKEGILVSTGVPFESLWVYPVENDAGYALYHYGSYLYCREDQYEEAAAYYRDPANWNAFR